MNKKGQGLSLNTIIIAIIVLFVLVIIIAVFSGSFGGFTKEFNNCATKGGHECTPGASCETGWSKDPVLKCKDTTGKEDTSSVCCVHVSTQ